jgi:hypothetical protein
MRYFFRTVFFVLLLLFSQFDKLMAGWLIVEINQDQYGSYTMQSTFIEGNMIRIETAESIVILDVDSSELCLVFPNKMLYWKGKPEELRKGIIETLEVQIQVMMQQLPASERQAFQNEFDTAMLSFGTESPTNDFYQLIEIKRMEEEDTIAGLQSTRYDIVIDSIHFEQVWLTNEVQPYGATELEAMLELTQIITKPTIVTAYRNSPDYIRLIKNGLVMRSVIPGPFGESISEVGTVREAKIPEILFQPPEDYRPAGLTEIIQIMLSDFEGAGQDKPETDKLRSVPKSPFDY